MAENKTNENDMTGDSNLTVIRIPDDKVDAVIGFINELESQETDVSGHMISGGALGSFGSLSARTTKHRTDTGCVQRKTGVGIDFDCSDSDTISS